MANYYYNNELGDNEKHVIYTDTDSIFVSALPLVKHRNPNADLTDDKYMTKEILNITSEVQDFLNKSYDVFAKRFLNCDNHKFDIKQEVISKAAFWVTKKRYGQWIINDGGVPCDKLDVKGLDIVRSSFPVAFKQLMTEVLQDILENADKSIIDEKILELKSSMKSMNLSDISTPTGVKNIKKFIDSGRKKFKTKGMFTDVRKGTPVHVKSAIIYNDLLKHFDLDKIEPIRNSDKIKWVYLKSNPLNIKTIAFKDYEDPSEIMDFIQQYVDYDKIFERTLNKKMKTWYAALSWEDPVDKRYTLDRFF